jgi:hypothetical protein
VLRHNLDQTLRKLDEKRLVSVAIGAHANQEIQPLLGVNGAELGVRVLEVRDDSSLVRSGRQPKHGQQQT